MSSIPYVTLNNGMKMPQLGLGVYLIKGQECVESVKNAIQMGYRLIDTAKYYSNEAEVGKGILQSNVNRSELFITSKIYSSGYDASLKAIDDSVKKIGSYIDLMLIHWVISDDVNTYKALEKALKDGKIKAIGVSNYFDNNLKRILNNCSIKPVVNQVECHVYCQQKEAHKMFTKNNIVMEAWSPFGGSSCRKVLSNNLLKSLGEKYKKSPAQISLKWMMQENIVAIPKTTHKERMKENLDIFDFEIEKDDIKKIKDLDKNEGFQSFWQ